ncbi:hypothetical protein Tco_0365623, partial [Tanacetum coccineum]
TRLERSHVRQTRVRVRLQRDEMIDITDLLESHRVDRLEMAELRSRAHDIEVILLEIERHLGP